MPTRASIGFGFCVSAQDIQCPLGLALGLVSVLGHSVPTAHWVWFLWTFSAH